MARLTNETSALQAWIGIGIAFLLCLSSSMGFYDLYVGYYRANPDPWAVAKQEVRFDALRAELPVTSILGYYSDVSSGRGGNPAAFYVALYGMSPHLLVPDSNVYKPEFVLGNFGRRPDLGQLEREKGLKLVKDYGRGVMLFRRERK
jgi:hypothetical protein